MQNDATKTKEKTLKLSKQNTKTKTKLYRNGAGKLKTNIKKTNIERELETQTCLKYGLVEENADLKKNASVISCTNCLQEEVYLPK